MKRLLFLHRQIALTSCRLKLYIELWNCNLLYLVDENINGTSTNIFIANPTVPSLGPRLATNPLSLFIPFYPFLSLLLAFRCQIHYPFLSLLSIFSLFSSISPFFSLHYPLFSSIFFSIGSIFSLSPTLTVSN